MHHPWNLLLRSISLDRYVWGLSIELLLALVGDWVLGTQFCSYNATIYDLVLFTLKFDRNQEY